MRKITLGFFAAGFVLLAAALIFNGTSEGDSNAKTSSSDRKMAPDFALTNLDGKQVRLSDYQGKIRIVDFWATWCPPCREEIPHFNEMSKTYADRNVVIIGVALDQNGAAAVRPFAQKNNIVYPLVLGDAQVVHAYGDIESIPTTFVIDQQGRIYKQYVGYRPKSVFEADIAALSQQGS